MSLPPALLAKLQRRGIIKGSNQGKDLFHINQPSCLISGDEVFAEQYDERKEAEGIEDTSQKKRGGAPGCPNKWNPYHLCSEFCFEHWKEGIPEKR